MRIGRTRKHKKTVEVTLILTPLECEQLSHAISCTDPDGGFCSFQDHFVPGRKLLSEFYSNFLSRQW